jgi:hypothetical protein
MESGSTKSGMYGLGVTLLSIGGFATLTIVGAVIGVPMMIAGVGFVIWGYVADEEESPDAEPA